MDGDIRKPPSDAEIADDFGRMLEAEASRPATETEADEANASPNPKPNPKREAEGGDSEPGTAEEAEESADAKPGDDAEAGDDSTVEVPDTLEALADSLEVDAKELASHIKVAVKIDGKTRHIPLSEAMASYQLGTSHQGKSQALADERRAFESERATFLAERQQVAQTLATLAQQVEVSLVGEMQHIDPAMEQNDPESYLIQRDRLRDRQERLAGIRNGLAQMDAYRQAQEQAQRAAYVQHEAIRLAEAVPEWGADPAGKGAKEISDLRKWAAETYGFTPEEVGGMVDHRTILAFRDLRRLRDMEGKAPALKKKLAALPKMQKPAPSRDRGEQARDDADAMFKRALKKGDDRMAGEALVRAGIV